MPETINNAVVFITCPGGSNVSLMSYKAASVLEQDGCGKFVKLAGDKFKERTCSVLPMPQSMRKNGY